MKRHSQNDEVGSFGKQLKEISHRVVPALARIEGHDGAFNFGQIGCSRACADRRRTDAWIAERFLWFPRLRGSKREVPPSRPEFVVVSALARMKGEVVPQLAARNRCSRACAVGRLSGLELFQLVMLFPRSRGWKIGNATATPDSMSIPRSRGSKEFPAHVVDLGTRCSRARAD